ncbi:MAG: hypothetical protein ISR58_12210 [Anaerolineales bacterium]|nr:hypothetical protein [Chloroflexota bacterium]MBL6981941.1 hypothetical protein [Anaerolineales bacterium]
MKTHPYGKFLLIMTRLFIPLGSTSCLPEDRSGIQVWIDFPKAAVALIGMETAFPMAMTCTLRKLVFPRVVGFMMNRNN